MKIPAALIATVAEEFSTSYIGAVINSKFNECGFAVDDHPYESKLVKCRTWLQRVNVTHNNPLAFLGKLIEEMMEKVPYDSSAFRNPTGMDKVGVQLEHLGFAYR